MIVSYGVRTGSKRANDSITESHLRARKYQYSTSVFLHRSGNLNLEGMYALFPKNRRASFSVPNLGTSNPRTLLGVNALRHCSMWPFRGFQAWCLHSFLANGGAWPSGLGRWIWNLEVHGSNPSPCRYLDLFSVVPSSTLRPRVV